MSARHIAWQILREISEKDAYANLITPRFLRSARLAESDRGFVTELVYGTLRLQGRYDAVIERASGRPIGDIEPGVLTILRIGCHQSLSLGTPAHAVVSESVNLAREARAARAAGFINAVMRRVSERNSDEWLAIVSASSTSEQQRLATVWSHPEWIVEQLSLALAADNRSTEIESLLEANCSPARVTLADLRRVNDPDVAPLDGMSEDNRTIVSATLTRGDPARVVRDSGGTVRVQDVGSQLAALVLGYVEQANPDEVWWDMCAGPGGKAALLAAVASRGGATVVANDSSQHRSDLVRESVRPFSNVEVTVRDARTPESNRGEYDRILLDAPCSGLGALRRRPESRWRKSPEDIPVLAQLQTELVESAMAQTKRGGYLAYVTCTPTVAETFEVIEQTLELSGDWEAVPVGPIASRVAPGLVIESRGNHLQLWPHLHDTDAMFISLFRRA